MLTKEINRLIAKLNYDSDDETAQLDASIELIEVLLFQMDHLQSFAISKGLTEDDFSDYMDTFNKRTIH